MPNSTRSRTRRPAVKPVQVIEPVEQVVERADAIIEQAMEQVIEQVTEPVITEPVMEPEVSTELVVIVHEAEIVEEPTESEPVVEPEISEPTVEPVATPMYQVQWFGAKDEALTYRGQKSRDLLDNDALEAFRQESRPPVAGASMDGKRRGILTIRAYDSAGEVIATQKPQELLKMERARTAANV